MTAILHEAYAPLAHAGMHFLASHQDPATTRRRVDRGTTIVAYDRDALVGVVTLADVDATRGSPFYDRPDVSSFGQFAVRPSHQKAGIATSLLIYVERLAREAGTGALGLDTAETADQLLAFYEKRGYRFVEYVKWPEVNYRSCVLGKELR